MSNQTQLTRRRGGGSVSQKGARAPDFRWLLFGVFVVALAFLGGSSRPDPLHNAMLRPFAAIMLIPALYSLKMVDLKRVQPLFILLMALIAWILLQLVPLPLELWRSLPGRQLLSDIDQIVGLDQGWRPISMAPFRGLDSAFSIVVPLAALVLALAMKVSNRVLLFAIVGIGIFNAALGLFQVAAGDAKSFYIFANASPGAVEGSFANENHSAVFSALVMLIVVKLWLNSKEAPDPTWLRLAYAPTFIFVLLAILVSGSRAGFASALVVLIASFALVVYYNRPGRLGGAIAIAAFVTTISVVVGAFLWLQQTPAVADMMRPGSFEDLRWSLWPILHEMASVHWLLGTGFGSFDAVYRGYEPTDLLLPAYLNHAHNDWAQLIIEGGLPAIMILCGLIWWLVRSVHDLQAGAHGKGGRAVFWVTCMAIIAAASLVDYPLRTPIFQSAAVWLMLCLSSDRLFDDAR